MLKDAEKAEFKRVRLSEKVWLGWLKIDVSFVCDMKRVDDQQEMLCGRGVSVSKNEAVDAL